MSRLAILLLAFVVVCGTAGIVIVCWLIANDRTREVLFVVPEGYRGIIRITNSPNGVTIEPDSRGVYRLSIPASGTLALAPPNVLRGWLHYSCITTKGTAIAVAFQSGRLNRNAIALRHVFDAGTGDGQQDAYYVIGTDDDRQNAANHIMATTPLPVKK